MYKSRILNSIRSFLYLLIRLPLLLTSAFRKSPDFLIIGTQKGGTSSLFYYLSQHPSLSLSSKKETHFFSKYYHLGTYWYKSFFPFKSNTNTTGEATPSYLYYDFVPERVYKFKADMKLIIMLRDPVSRAISQFFMEKKRGNTGLGDITKIINESYTNGGGTTRTPWHQHYNDYFSRGKYYTQINRWLEFFDKDQILFLKSEAFFRDPYCTLKAVYHFLEIEDFKPDKLEAKNTGNYDYEIDPEQLKQLTAYYDDEYTKLESLIDLELNWRKEL